MPKTVLTFDDSGLPQAHGRLLRLAPKARAVLRLLLQRSPEVVAKDEFAAGAWAGQEMSDASLARAISTLRRALLPLGLKVEPVYGLGYRLAEPDPPESGAPETRVRKPTAQSLDAHAHARQLLQQRTPTAVGLAIDLLRRLTREAPEFAAARVALADALSVAVAWGQLPTLAAVDEGLAAVGGLNADGVAVPGLDAARGALLDMAWRFDEAQVVFERALVVDGESPDTLLAYSRHLLYADQAGRAVDVLRRVQKLAPHALHPRMTLARALIQSGRGDEAMAEMAAAAVDHPGQLVVVALSLAIQALARPHAELEAATWRLTQVPDAPPFVWTVAAFVLARLQRREAALDIIDTALLCSSTTPGEAALYAAPLASLGEHDRAAGLLRVAVDEHCGMMAMVLRDPAHAEWLPYHPAGRALLRTVFGRAA